MEKAILNVVHFGREDVIATSGKNYLTGGRYYVMRGINENNSSMVDVNFYADDGANAQWTGEVDNDGYYTYQNGISQQIDCFSGNSDFTAGSVWAYDNTTSKYVPTSYQWEDAGTNGKNLAQIRIFQ